MQMILYFDNFEDGIQARAHSRTARVVAILAVISLLYKYGLQNTLFIPKLNKLSAQYA